MSRRRRDGSEEARPANIMQVAQFRDTVSKVVSMLTERGMTVTQQGIHAYVRYNDQTGLPELVNIPVIPDSADETFLSAVRGFIDHECAHVLFSDGRLLVETCKANPQVKAPLNILEDVFIERRMIEKFPGAAKHIASTWEFVLEKQVLPVFHGAKNEAGRHGALLPAMMHAWSGKREAQEFLTRHDLWKEIEPVAEALEPLRERIAQDWSSTAETVPLASEMLELLRKVMPPPSSEPGKSDDKSDGKPGDQSEPSGKGETPSNAKQEPGDDPGETADDQDDQGEGESDAQKSDKGDADKGDADADADSEGEGEGDDPSKGETGQADAAPSDGKQNGARDGEDGVQTESNDQKPATTDAEIHASQELPPLLEEVRDFESQMSDVLRKLVVDGVKDGDYLVFTRDHDEFVKPDPYPGKEAPAQAKVDEIERATLAMTGQLSNQFRRLFAAQEQVLNVGGMRAGRLQSNALHRLAVQDDRVFYRREEHTALDTAVTLMVDCSGSMADSNKIGLAIIAAYAFSVTLERVGIAHEVLGFTTRDDYFLSNEEHERLYEQMRDLNRGFSRYDTIRMLEFKTFEERLRKTRLRFGAMAKNYAPRYPLYSNVDGESLLYGAERLLKRRERRKVMVVFSDGMPAAAGNGAHLARHLKQVVEELTKKAGIEMLGIGIKSTDVREFYPQNVVLEHAEDLPQTVMREITQILLRQRR